MASEGLTTTPDRMTRWMAFALVANAAAVLVMSAVVLLRDDARGPGLPSLLPAAWAQQPPIAGGAGVFIMPAQLSSNTWGVYLLDVDAQTLAVYQYLPGDRQLQLVAARTYRHDRRLQQFNTAAPSPREVEELLRMEERLRRGGASEAIPSGNLSGSVETPGPTPGAGASGGSSGGVR